MKSSAKKKFLKELTNVPIVSVAAKAAGVSRQTVYRWMQEDKQFAIYTDKAKSEGVDHINDISETQIISMVKDRKWPVIKYWLKHHHVTYRERTLDKPDKIKDEQLSAEEIQTMDAMIAKFTKPRDKA